MITFDFFNDSSTELVEKFCEYFKLHVLLGGRIVKSGGPELAVEIENKGFDWIKAETSAV